MAADIRSPKASSCHLILLIFTAHTGFRRYLVLTIFWRLLGQAAK